MRRSVLIVDDHRDFRTAARALIELEGTQIFQKLDLTESADQHRRVLAVLTFLRG